MAWTISAEWRTKSILPSCDLGALLVVSFPPTVVLVSGIYLFRGSSSIMTDKEGPAETETAYVVLASSTNNDNNAHGQGGRDGTTVEKSVVTNEYKGEEPTNTTSQQQRNRSEDIAICCDARRYLIILNVLNLILVSVSVVVDLVSQDGPINLNEIHYGIYICNVSDLVTGKMK